MAEEDVIRHDNVNQPHSEGRSSEEALPDNGDDIPPSTTLISDCPYCPPDGSSLTSSIVIPDAVPGVPLVKLAAEDTEEEDEEPVYNFKIFNKKSYAELLRGEREYKRIEKKRKDFPMEGRLVDGELIFDDDGDENKNDRDPTLVAGNTLPLSMEEDFPPELLGTPLEEIDHYIKDKVCVHISHCKEDMIYYHCLTFYGQK